MLELDANKLLEDANAVTNTDSDTGCYFTLFSDSYANTGLRDKWVFGSIIMKQLVVEYDYTQAYNAGDSGYTKYKNRVGLGMIDSSIIPPDPPSPTPVGPTPSPDSGD